MPILKDLVGKKFGKLLVLERINKELKIGLWLCRCDCGNNRKVSSGHLNSGLTISCGCHYRASSIVNKKFGKLKVLSFVYRKNNHTYWECLCVCGKIIISNANNLKRGNTRSCGCYSAKLQEKTNLKKYGTKSSFQNKKTRKKFEMNNIKKYGVPYPAQNLEISLKTARSQKNCYILCHWKTNQELICQASWEKKVVEYLNINKIDFNWKPEIFSVIVNNKRRKYFPDLYLVNNDIWVEIKGYKREVGMKKWNYFHKYIKPNSELWDKEKLKKMKII